MRGTNFDYDGRLRGIGAEILAISPERVADHYIPTPETEPCAIAADQRAAINNAIAELGTWDVGQISTHVCLPVFVVGCRIAEIRKRTWARVAV